MQIDEFEVKTFPAIDSVGLSTAKKPLRVCIVTEEIIGPVRNGGIASTYYHLSKGLAANGHEVHVLFLKGPVVQDETPEHWVKHFADFGVTLHYLQFPEQPCWGAAVEWQERFAAAYHWLRDQDPFDVVHTSEWRGGMVYALMAKRLGLAFQETLFLVKTSSPHIWNRHYQMQPIERRELVLAAYAEQKCVELADAVIGGSAHLITFMGEIGYKVPDANVFVQPNIVDFKKVIVTDQRPPRKPGDLVKTQELIFFGRLEGRKGVELMCNALDILKERGIAPEKVSFMGKWGAPLATQGGMKVEDYINAKAEAWDFPVTLITDKNQPEALSHMCSRDMIAVMPSLIENSTMAVYETLENNIPFIATAVGGTPELIDAGDHERSLVEPKSTALADQLERVLKEGQVIAHSSFSNDENLRVWYGFHAHVGEKIDEIGRAAAIREITAEMDKPGSDIGSIGFAALVRRGDDLKSLAAALAKDAPDRVVLGFNDAAMRPAVTSAANQLADAGIDARVLDCIGQAAGDALNALAQDAGTDATVFAHGAGVRPRPGFFEAAKLALGHRPDCLFTTFFHADGDILGLPIGGDIASHFLTSRAYGPELFAMRAETYARLGPFEPYDVRQGILHEYVTRAVEKGPDDLLVFPETLLDWPQAPQEARDLAEDAVYAYLKAKPLIDNSSIAQRKINLAALHQTRGGGSALDDKVLRDGGRGETDSVWLMPTDWNRIDITQPLKRALVVGLDEATDSLILFARGPGIRMLKLRDSVQTIDLIEEHGEEGSDEYLTLSRYPLPEAWDAGTSYPISWGLYDLEGQKLRNQFLRINKLTVNTYALAARNPIMSALSMTAILQRQKEVTAYAGRLGSDQAASDLADLLGGSGSFDDVTASSDDLGDLMSSGVIDPDGESAGPGVRLSQKAIDMGLSYDEVLSLAGVDAADVHQPEASRALERLGYVTFDKPAATRPGVRLRKADLDRGMDVDALLSLATGTGRAELERQALRAKSATLIETLTAPVAAENADMRAFLNAPKDAAGWCAGDWLVGWAWDRANRDTTVHVAVLSGDTPLFIAAASVEMPALGRRTPGLEAHGYRIPVSQDMVEAAADGALSVVVWENRTPVRNGTLTRALDEPDMLLPKD